MFRSILYALTVLLALRFASVIARMITAGKRSGPKLEPQDRGDAHPSRERPPRPRADRQDAIDVPFTDIPPDSKP